MPLSPTTPEINVSDVRAAQEYYRDVLGFEIGWHLPDAGLGAVSRDECVIFFRESPKPAVPAAYWIFCEDVDAVYDDLMQRGATLNGPPENKPWDLRQFTVIDAYGNSLTLHVDI